MGARTAETALKLVRSGLAHLIASDAHSPTMRGFDLGTAASRVGDAALADWLVDGVPAAIAAGTPLPERPATTRRRWLRR